jgi:hypothetical protein
MFVGFDHQKDQTHTAKAGLSWRLGRWNFSAAAELHSGWPSTELLADTMIAADGSSQLLLATTPRNSGRYDTFHTLDARISREFRPGIGELTAFLDITNVYDRANPCCTEYSVTVGPAGVPALIAEGDNWLPLLPSLGVIWRF